MIPLLTRAQARALDEASVFELGIPSLVLMENAGLGACNALLARHGAQAGRIVILGGTGQNGGDGWVLARQLFVRGVLSVPVLIGERVRVQGDAAVNLKALDALGLGPLELRFDALDPLEAVLHDATLIVDGLFGTGLDRPLEDGYAEAVELVNAARADVVALDLPSGVDADTGEILGVAVRATTTITFGGHKRGLHQHPGVDCAGTVVEVPIGVPSLSDESVAYLFEPQDVAHALEPRARDAHKGTAGHVLVLAGSPGKTGAAVLAGRGALRCGAGLVTIAARGAARAAIDAKVLELMTEELDPSAASAVPQALALASGKDAAVIGPGLGTDVDGKALARALVERLPIPAVVDADALTALAGGGLEAIKLAAAPRVFTPHPGEAARLLGTTIDAVQADRYGASLELAQTLGAVVILKGARTVVAAPDGRVRVCRRGTPALGTAGTGDVLAGVVASLLAGEEPLTAACVGVCLHAIAGELAARGDRGLLASEVADALPLALVECCKDK